MILVRILEAELKVCSKLLKNLLEKISDKTISKNS